MRLTKHVELPLQHRRLSLRRYLVVIELIEQRRCARQSSGHLHRRRRTAAPNPGQGLRFAWTLDPAVLSEGRRQVG